MTHAPLPVIDLAHRLDPDDQVFAQAPVEHCTRIVLVEITAIVDAVADADGVTDLVSVNGTWVNGTRVERASLKPGDVVILTTPPAFRWAHFTYAIEKGLNVFMEKPVTVDGPTTCTALATASNAGSSSPPESPTTT